MKILNLTKNSTLATSATLADTFFSRMAGLLPKENLSEQEALIITRCQSIHMLFMRFAIDVVFADRNYTVVGIVQNIRPFRLSPIFLKSFFAIELPVGRIESTQTKVGDQLIVQP